MGNREQGTGGRKGEREKARKGEREKARKREREKGREGESEKARKGERERGRKGKRKMNRELGIKGLLANSPLPNSPSPHHPITPSPYHPISNQRSLSQVPKFSLPLLPWYHQPNKPLIARQFLDAQFPDTPRNAHYERKLLSNDPRQPDYF